MRRLRRLPGIALAAAALAGVAVLSQWPYRAEAAERSLLRLSWRARGERVEHCRRATAEELAALPAHMRQELVCGEARVAAYRLRIAVDGLTLEDGIAAGSGVPGDRPIYVLREFEVAPGPRRIEVRFVRSGAGEEGGEEERRRSVPPRLELDTSLTVANGTVLLVTYDSERGRLVLLAP